MRKHLLMISLATMLIALPLSLLYFFPAWAADCSVPPFLTSGVQSNVLVIMDNSMSMGEFAYKESLGKYGTVSTPDPAECDAYEPRCNLNCAAYTKKKDCTSQKCQGILDWSCRGTGTNIGQCNFYQHCEWSATTSKCYEVEDRPNENQDCSPLAGNQDKCDPTLTPPANTSGQWHAHIKCQSTSGGMGDDSDAWFGYVPNKKYYGYFDPDKTYKYNKAKHYFEAVGTVVDPQNKGYRGAGTSTSNDTFSGNWMNWLCMRRIDIAKKVLTGGRLGGDENEYVLVGTPSTHRDQYKIFQDTGGDGVYYTPFHQEFGVFIYSNLDTAQRTPGATATGPIPGPYVPLIGFFSAVFPNSAQAKTYSRGYPLDDFSLGKDGTYGNEGEPKTEVGRTGERTYKGCYYFAIKHSAVSEQKPPTGIVQNMADKVRLGLMQFNYGQGPAEAFTLGNSPPAPLHVNNPGVGDCPYGQVIYGGQPLCGFNPNGDSVDSHTYVSRYADGGRILNRIADRSTIDSWQIQQTGMANPGQPVRIYSIVQNINETLCLTWTPLAETLREAMKYFRQESPSYAYVDTPGNLKQDFYLGQNDPDHPSDPQYNWDPYYYYDPDPTKSGKLKCIKSYIVLVTAGEPSQDHPCKSGCTTQGANTCSRTACSDVTNGVRAKDGTPFTTFRFDAGYDGGEGYLDNIAYKLWVEDNRPDDIDDIQSVSLYAVYAFDRPVGIPREYLERAALAGGFTDLNKDGEPGKPYSSSPLTCGTPGADPNRCSTWLDSYNWLNYDGWYEWDTGRGAPKPDHFFDAKDGYELERVLQSIFSQIALGGAAGAVATISQQTKEGDAIIRGAFDAADPSNRSRYLWNGRLEVYWPDKEAEYEFDNPANTGLFCSQMATNTKCPDGPSGRCCWDAAEKLKSLSDRSTRTIFTYIKELPPSGCTAAAGKMSFVPDNWKCFQELMRDPVDGVLDQTEIREIINWTRGQVDASTGQPPGGANYRNRKGYVLGDIVYSTPVIVGPPPLASVSSADKNLVRGTADYQDGVEAFWDFRNYWLGVEDPSKPGYKGRPKIAYVGANDGMLHAFLIARLKSDTNEWDYDCADCGAELWAYIPSNMLGELKALTKVNYGDSADPSACQHRTMVDLSPRAWDVFINSDACTARSSPCGDKRCWRTIIIGGERGGGDTYFALDVTDPTDPKVLWEYPVLKNLAVVYAAGSGETRIGLPFRENDYRHDADTGNDTTCPDSNWLAWANANCFDSMYFKLKTLPMSWTRAALGRVRIPSKDVQFWRYVPGSPAPTLGKTAQFTDCDNKRHIAFIGTGFQIFNDPMAAGNYPDVPAGIPQSVKNILNKPELLAIDVETGENYFQVLWPLAVWARSTATPDLLNDEHIPATSTSNFIPWAFGSPALVDVWGNNDRDQSDTAPPNDLTGMFAEDGFVDRLYIGDMRGYLNRMAFNLKDYGQDNATYHKGMNIETWLTKPIPAASDPNNPATCDQTNSYRGCRQPISVAPAISYDVGTAGTDDPKLRVLFGTGKFDKVKGSKGVIGEPGDDKTDRTKMSFYNLVDEIKGFNCSYVDGKTVCQDALPTISPSASYRIDSSGLITPSGSNPQKGFLVDGTNFGLTFGDGACKSETSAAYDSNKYRGCSETQEDCDEATKTRVCGTDAVCKAACKMVRRDNCCDWVKSVDGTADSCQATQACDSYSPTPTKCAPCWDCIFDLAAEGERVIGDPLIAYGMVFFTTYIPDAGPCAAGGEGWLYMLDYRCKALPNDFNPVTEAFGHTAVQVGNFGAKVDLGQGMPSEPVMDSTGQYIFVQKSDATVVKIGTAGGGDGGGGGGGAFRDIQFKGWDKK